MYHFGAGLLWGTPQLDAAGAAIATPTPLLFGTSQGFDLDIGFELKELHGQNQFAVAVGRGKGSIKGKVTAASIMAGFLETIVFGQAGADGLVSIVNDTVGVEIPVSPYQVTVAPPGAGTFDVNLGVINSATGRPLKRVAAAPASGQYTVTAGGQYTFAAADVGVTVYICYRYKATSTTARVLTIRNLPMGYAPTFRGDFYGTYQGQGVVFTLNSCISDGFKFSTKNDDFTVPEIGFTAQSNAAGIIGTMAFTE